MKNIAWIMWITLAAFTPTLAAAAANPHYVIKGSEVYDKDTNLTWQRCSVGQNWKDGVGCSGTIRTFTYEEAQRQASGNWRMPNKDEMAGLIDHDRQDFPTIDADAFPDMSRDSATYWTGTPETDERSWDVRFKDGNVTDDVNSWRFAIRLVKNGK